MTLSTLVEESKGDPLLESAYRRVIALFEDLIRQKLRVRVYYGKAVDSNLLEGVITKHDAKSGWIQVGNLRLPLDWVVKIEIVEEVPDETRQRKKRPNDLHRPEHYP